MENPENTTNPLSDVPPNNSDRGKQSTIPIYKVWSSRLGRFLNENDDAHKIGITIVGEEFQPRMVPWIKLCPGSGHHDRDGKRIFHGDIVQSVNKPPSAIHQHVRYVCFVSHSWVRFYQVYTGTHQHYNGSNSGYFKIVGSILTNLAMVPNHAVREIFFPSAKEEAQLPESTSISIPKETEWYSQNAVPRSCSYCGKDTTGSLAFAIQYLLNGPKRSFCSVECRDKFDELPAGEIPVTSNPLL